MLITQLSIYFHDDVLTELKFYLKKSIAVNPSGF